MSTSTEPNIGIESNGAHDRTLARLVAVTIIVLSVFMTISKVKDDNIVQTQQQAKADVVDTWSEYQATKVKLHLSEEAAGLDRILITVPGVDAAVVRAHMTSEENAITKYQAKTGELMSKARAAETRVEQLGRQDDQFDMADALLAIALAVSATAILVESYLILFAGWAFGSVGLMVGVVGFLGASLRIEWLINLLN
jgi:hypothetical protein